ncbi:MAG: hypothetical protein H7Y37_15460 [Anaerolineae bacterium]|nr:hypothetical protein [Gloeobacterales cyanobacterium ES-bin-313]
MTFKAADPDALRSATLITLALGEPNTLNAWSKIYETTSCRAETMNCSATQAYGKFRKPS